METIIADTQDNKRKVSQQQLLDAIRTIMLAIGEDPEREGLQETPARIARMYQEIFRGYDPERKPAITTFTNSAHTSEMVFDSGEYYSMCEHHMLPFFGKYYFAYVPNPDGRILGISKVARVVSYCAARLQLQERLCREIIDMLSEALDGCAGGFAIVMKGKHLCKSMRGIRNDGDMTVSHFTGCFKEDAQLRNEFFSMIHMQ
ncbi:MAG: GTP cyclohydrolase I [Prevotella sp.]|jgi:GTP cyclohydrolase I|nr:GTP cyclohydrolase I [Prevotella sp.]